MSLCHQPAARRLSVVILKARNVPKMDITGFSGSFQTEVIVASSMTFVKIQKK